jgi:hypothetical protein
MLILLLFAALMLVTARAVPTPSRVRTTLSEALRNAGATTAFADIVNYAGSPASRELLPSIIYAYSRNVRALARRLPCPAAAVGTNRRKTPHLR